MTSLLSTPAAAKTNSVEIKGAAYAVEPIAPGEFGTSAVRVTKLASGESYDLIRTRENVVECTCPDFVCRHEGNGTVCKHGAAMVARGFLPPAPVVAKPTVAPITYKDRVRASYFGLRLPVAPAPVKVEIPVLETPALVVETSVKGLADRLWMAETTALLITIDATEGMEWENAAEGRSFDSEAVFDRLEPENQLAFHTFLKMIGSPVSTWHDWLDLCWAGSTVSFPEPTGPRPTRIGRFVPTVEMDLERLGFALGYEGEEAAAPKGRSYPELLAFYTGFVAGKATLEAEYNEWLDSIEADRERMDDAFGGPDDSWNEAEMTEAGSRSGHPAYEG